MPPYTLHIFHLDMIRWFRDFMQKFQAICHAGFCQRIDYKTDPSLRNILQHPTLSFWCCWVLRSLRVTVQYVEWGNASGALLWHINHSTEKQPNYNVPTTDCLWSFILSQWLAHSKLKSAAVVTTCTFNEVHHEKTDLPKYFGYRHQDVHDENCQFSSYQAIEPVQYGNFTLHLFIMS